MPVPRSRSFHLQLASSGSTYPRYPTRPSPWRAGGPLRLRGTTPHAPRTNHVVRLPGSSPPPGLLSPPRPLAAAAPRHHPTVFPISSSCRSFTRERTRASAKTNKPTSRPGHRARACLVVVLARSILPRSAAVDLSLAERARERLGFVGTRQSTS